MNRWHKLHRTAALALVTGWASVSCVHGEPESQAQSSWSRIPVTADPGLRDPQLARGQELFRAHCLACHGEIPPEFDPAGMPPMPGTQALKLRYQGEKPELLEQRNDLTPEMIAAFVRNGINSMPPFRPTELSDEELAALGAYLARNLR